jgi:hypothetical protein
MVSLLGADGPTDNIAEKVRRIPPPGIKLSAADRDELPLASPSSARK